MSSDGGQLCSGLFTGVTRFQSRRDCQRMVVPLVESVRHRSASLDFWRIQHRLHRKGHPQLAVEADFGADEIFWSDAGYGKAKSVQRNFLTDDGGVRIKARAPEVLTEDDHGRRGLTVLRDKRAPFHRANAEHVKVVFGHVLALEQFRLPASCEAELARTRDGGHALEALCLLSVVQIVRVRDRSAQPHDATLLLDDWQGTNEYDVDDAEDRRVETDTERQQT